MLTSEGWLSTDEAEEPECGRHERSNDFPIFNFWKLEEAGTGGFGQMYTGGLAFAFIRTPVTPKPRAFERSYQPWIQQSLSAENANLDDI